MKFGQCTKIQSSYNILYYKLIFYYRNQDKALVGTFFVVVKYSRRFVIRCELYNSDIKLTSPRLDPVASCAASEWSDSERNWEELIRWLCHACAQIRTFCLVNLHCRFNENERTGIRFSKNTRSSVYFTYIRSCLARIDVVCQQPGVGCYKQCWDYTQHYSFPPQPRQ